jgi:hypothetical protein
MWFDKIKCLKRVQQRYQMEFRVDSPSVVSIYAFYKQFCEIRYFMRRGSSFCCKLYGWKRNANLMCEESPVMQMLNI